MNACSTPSVVIISHSRRRLCHTCIVGAKNISSKSYGSFVAGFSLLLLIICSISLRIRPEKKPIRRPVAAEQDAFESPMAKHTGFRTNKGLVSVWYQTEVPRSFSVASGRERCEFIGLPVAQDGSVWTPEFADDRQRDLLSGNAPDLLKSSGIGLRHGRKRVRLIGGLRFLASQSTQGHEPAGKRHLREVSVHDLFPHACRAGSYAHGVCCRDVVDGHEIVKLHCQLSYRRWRYRFARFCYDFAL